MKGRAGENAAAVAAVAAVAAAVSSMTRGSPLLTAGLYYAKQHGE